MRRPTLLERYWKVRLDFESRAKETMPEPSQLWAYQELVYRIGVLEVFRMFSKAAPFTDDMATLILHYHAVNGYIEHLRTERICLSTNPENQKQMETALAGLTTVIDDYRRRYASYAPGGPEQYAKDIANTISSILPAWVQYRNTIIELKITEEEDVAA